MCYKYKTFRVIKLDGTEVLLCEDCLGYYQQDLELEEGYIPALDITEAPNRMCEECGLSDQDEEEGFHC